MAEVFPPVILRSIPQRSTGGPPSALEAQEAREAVLRLQLIGFAAVASDGEARTFTVLAGDAAPVPTEGWVKLQKVQRFQRVSVTIPEGYDPYVLSVPVRFDAVALPFAERRKAAQRIEANIKTLEWMAGREPHGEAQGPPPQVQVVSCDSNGRLTNLVPTQFQTVEGQSQQWYIMGITHETAIRGNGGDRIRQDSTILLTEIVATESQVNEARRRREEVKGQFRTVRATAVANTIKRIAVREGIPAGWKAILAANRNLGTNPEKALPSGTKVRIPLALFRQVAR
jgi:hypothetical protein